MSTLPAHAPLPDDFVTVAEAAALLRVAPSTIRRWIRQGTVPAYRIGPRRVALKRGELATLVAPTAANENTHGTGLRYGEGLLRRLTLEQQQRGLAALERAERLSQEIAERRRLAGFPPLPPSWEVIAEMRDERDRELDRRRG
jgi:excisionase family DNA binding protein